MANNTYVIDEIVTGPETITLSDDGTGSDTLSILGNYPGVSDVRLGWTTDNGVSTSASGIYYNPADTGHRLIVNGLIENVRGSVGQDFIQGNERGNLLFGDQTATGPGLADTVYGLSGNDSIYGGAGGDLLGGDAGADRIYGGLGNDVINGGAGADTIWGGAGADVLSGGGDARDVVAYSGSAAGVQIRITHGTATLGTGGDALGDTLSGFTDVIGSSYGDIITDTVKTTIAFGYNDNRFSGGSGNDRLYLGGGDDTGTGGNGSDYIWGEVGNDSLAGDAGNDRIYGGSGHDTASGGVGNDLVRGDSGNDSLGGSAGNDTLIGGSGRDTLLGGTGSDRFVYQSRTESGTSTTSRDSILDFSQIEGDRIDLRAIDALTTVEGNDVFVFIGTAVFSGDGAEIRFSALNGGFLVAGDTNANGVADFSIFVDGATLTTLVESDFLL